MHCNFHGVSRPGAGAAAAFVVAGLLALGEPVRAQPAPPRTPIPGADALPPHVEEGLRSLPRIEEFRATIAECPAIGSDPGPFLYYRVSNGVSRISIDALYTETGPRRVYTRSAPTPGRLEGRTADRSLSTGQVAYVLKAWGAAGNPLTRRIAFRTSTRPSIVFQEPWREILHPAAGRNPITHYEADVDVTNLSALGKMVLVLVVPGAEKAGTLSVEFVNGRLVSTSTQWSERGGASGGRRFRRDEVERGILKVAYSDPCPGSEPFEISNPVRLAP
jgi:hypothetical protein